MKENKIIKSFKIMLIPEFLLFFALIAVVVYFLVPNEKSDNITNKPITKIGGLENTSLVTTTIQQHPTTIIQASTNTAKNMALGIHDLRLSEKFSAQDHPRQAAYWAAQAAMYNNKKAEKILENDYFNGNGVQKNPQKATFWKEKYEWKPAIKTIKKTKVLTKKEKEQLYMNSLNRSNYYNKGKYYLQKKHLNYIFSTHYFSKAAKLGYIPAYAYVGQAYLVGYGVPVNNKKAMYWLHQGANANNSLAEYYLAEAYNYKYENTPSNDPNNNYYIRMVSRLLKESAKQHNEKAEYLLGKYYLKGDYVNKSEDKGIFWLKKRHVDLMLKQSTNWVNIILMVITV